MKHLISVIVGVAIVLGAVFFMNTKYQEQIFGFAGGGETYSYKAISSTQASSTAGFVVKGGAGTLGSITVGSTSATIVRIYDGNSTATSSGTLIGTLKASVAEQTFLYDVAVTKGIVLELISYNGSLTVGFK